MTAHHDTGPHRVVIVGGGFGGLLAARFLGNKPVSVTLIDRRNHHLFQPLLYQVATGMLSPGQISVPLRHVVRKKKNVNVMMSEVTGFDLDRKIVYATVAEVKDIEVGYDSLIVASGATQSYFGHEEMATFAPGMKTVDDAQELRRRIFGAFEMAELAPNPQEKKLWLTVVIVGAGPTGVELAGQVRELGTRSLKGEFRTFHTKDVRVILVDGGSTPLASFGNRLSEKAVKELGHLGVELKMGARVVGTDSNGVAIEDGEGHRSRIDAHTVIWAAGVEASPLAGALAKASGASTDRAGRLAVQPDLTVPGYPDVFAIGDMTTLNDLPGVAEVAMQGGLHAANSILRGQRGQPTETFKYRDLGNVATIGRFRAIASVGKLRLSGFVAWLVWFFVHMAFLLGYGNRPALFRWLRSMIGRSRDEREFSTAHGGGDLSLPPEARAALGGVAFPHADEYLPPQARQNKDH